MKYSSMIRFKKFNDRIREINKNIPNNSSISIIGGKSVWPLFTMDHISWRGDPGINFILCNRKVTVDCIINDLYCEHDDIICNAISSYETFKLFTFIKSKYVADAFDPPVEASLSGFLIDWDAVKI